MNANQLKAFVTVAQEGNLTRAAERLHLTQPALSVQIKNLQEELDLTLVVRTAKGLSITADGKEILPMAVDVLQGMAKLIERAANMQNSIRGDLVLGTTLNPEVTRLGSFLARLLNAHPQVRVKLHHGMSGGVLEQVQRGAADAGLYVGPFDEPLLPNICYASLTDFTHFVIAPKGWKNRVSERSWEELSTLPWILPYPNSVHNRLLVAKFKAVGVEPNVIAEVDVEASMLDMVKAGIGLALAREPVAIRESQAHGLVVLDHLPLPARLSFISLAERRDEPAIRAAFDAIMATFSDET